MPLATSAIATGAAWALVETRTLYDILRGKQNIAIYEGTYDGINSVIASLQTYERFELEQDPPKYRLIVTTPDLAEAPVWELLSNFKEKAITEHAHFAILDDHDVKAIVQDVQNSDPHTTPTLDATGPALTAANLLYDMLLHKQDRYFAEDYVLRLTTTVTNAISLNLAYANTDKTFTTAAMLTPATSGITIPAGIALSMGNIPAQANTGDFIWSWLKRPPQARQSQIGKVVISMEWWLQLWPNTLYPNVA